MATPVLPWPKNAIETRDHCADRAAEIMQIARDLEAGRTDSKSAAFRILDLASRQLRELERYGAQTRPEYREPNTSPLTRRA